MGKKADEVEAWMAEYENPMKPVVEKVREIMLGADDRMTECIKWKTPTFAYKGNLMSFNPRSKKHASLLFHTGAEIPGDFPLLEGDTPTARTAKIESVEDAEARADELRQIVVAWCDLKDGVL